MSTILDQRLGGVPLPIEIEDTEALTPHIEAGMPETRAQRSVSRRSIIPGEMVL